MPLLSRDEIKQVVKDCLREIGGFDGDIESLSLKGSDDRHLDRFVDCIVGKLTNKRITVVLSVSFVRRMIDDDKTIGDLIDHINGNQMYG